MSSGTSDSALIVTTRPHGDLQDWLRTAMPTARVEVVRQTEAATRDVSEHQLILVDARGEAFAVYDEVKRLREKATSVPLIIVLDDVSASEAEQMLGSGADECCLLDPQGLSVALGRARARRAAANAVARAMHEENERTRQARLKRHNEALRVLAKQLPSDDLCTRLRAITEAAAHSMDMARSGVWLFDKDRGEIRTVDLFDRRSGEHESGLSLLARDCPEYFRALEDQRVIAAVDARNHPVTRSFAASYLEPLGITSLLDAPIRVGSRVLGVLCHEHVGPMRKFTDEDEAVAGSFADFVALAIESHDLRRAEEQLRSTNSQLEEARRIEAVGRLAGGVAHDFNNVITVVSSYAFLLAKRLANDDPLQAPVAEIGKAAERAADITRKLLALSRREAVAPRVFDLNGVVRDMETFLRRLIGEHIALRLELWDEPLLLRTDPGQLEQIVLNLVVNARDAARPQGSSITIRTLFDGGTRKKAERPCALEVVDTGVGMTPDVQARIFEPFFTTKEVGKGSGLGLFTVWGAVTQMGGTIEVKSTPNKGTRFTLRFAQATPESRRAQPGTDRRELLGNETLLLVEDEAQVRDVTALILRDLGYRVLEASNIDEAIAHARNTRRIDLLVSDIVMPKASGTVVAARLKERIPSLRVLFISGYSKDMLSAYDASLGPTLPKPFTTEQLGKKVREVLDGGLIGPTARASEA